MVAGDGIEPTTFRLWAWPIPQKIHQVSSNSVPVTRYEYRWFATIFQVRFAQILHNYWFRRTRAIFLSYAWFLCFHSTVDCLRDSLPDETLPHKTPGIGKVYGSAQRLFWNCYCHDFPCGELDPLAVEHGNFIAFPIPDYTFHGAGTGHHTVFAKCSMTPSGSAAPDFAHLSMEAI